MPGLNCGVCSEEVLSDAGLKTYCKSCGMGLTTEYLIGGNDLAFCGQNCLDAYTLLEGS